MFYRDLWRQKSFEWRYYLNKFELRSVVGKRVWKDGYKKRFLNQTQQAWAEGIYRFGIQVFQGDLISFGNLWSICTSRLKMFISIL